jgi:cation transporter-like permease
MVNWKHLLLPALIMALGLCMLFAQMIYEWVNFANIWSQRIYIILCTGVMSIAHGMTKVRMNSKLQSGLLMFVVLNVVLLLFGGFGAINDAINGTTITEGSGIYMAYDVLSTPFTSKAIEFKIIVQTLIGTLPAIILLFSVVSVWTADSPDEQQAAIIEFAIVLGIVLSFSFFGNLFNFAWV